MVKVGEGWEENRWSVTRITGYLSAADAPFSGEEDDFRTYVNMRFRHPNRFMQKHTVHYIVHLLSQICKQVRHLWVIYEVK